MMYICKVKEKIFLIVVALALLVGCSNSELPLSAQELSSSTLKLEGYQLFRAKGSSVTLGTDDPSASIKSRPSMTSKFDYDFFMGKHEVTCAEMGADCEASMPVTDVTFYDAVLYANRLSVANGFDTAYSYTKAVYDKMGACIDLEGFVFHPEKNAFRLPTEAEWVYVASQDWNPKVGWHSENSNFERHPVCSAKADSNGICDMAGNVMEWVYDLYAPFRSGETLDYAGGTSSDGIGERVLKGGCYNNAPISLHLYNRGDVYMVTSSSKANYVGFRLAFGAIPNPSYMDMQGNDAQVNFSLLVKANTVKDFVGKSLSKLVFRDDIRGSLAYVDFDSEVLSVVNIDLSVSAYHPDISPDGRYVAFCTGVEGISGTSKVYVRQLSEDGSLIELPVKSAAIPRWRVLENGDTAIVYVTDAGNNKLDADFKSFSTWQVPFVGGKFGAPVKLFDGNYHGGISSDGNLSVTGSKTLRARKNGLDEIWYGGEQACNVSLNRGTGKQTLFLDFAGKTGRSYVGENYATHERVLFMDSTGSLIHSLKAPKGFTFDHTEWTVGSDSFFVATLADVNGNHKKIVLLNSNTGEMLPLIEGAELWHPAFWMQDRNVDSRWDYDSLGLYYTENGQPIHLLAQKMPLLWRYRDSAEVVCLGNSHIQAGVNPAELSFFAINFSTVPCDMHCVEYLYETYITTQVSHLKYLVIGIDFDLWNEFEPGESVTLNMGDAPGFQYDINHDYWREGVDNAFVERTAEFAPINELYASVRRDRGWLSQVCIADWGSEGKGYAEVLADSTWNGDSHRYEQNYAQLDKILKIAEQHGVVVVGLILPMSPYYRNTGSYGRHGMRRSVAEQLIERLKKVAAESENFVLMDENKMGNHDYLGDVANDYDHLCDVGAKKLTLRLDSLLKTLENQ